MKQGARILVVEDEAHLAEGLLFNLQAEGYEVELAYDGEGALSLLLPATEVEASEEAGKDGALAGAGATRRAGMGSLLALHEDSGGESGREGDGGVGGRESDLQQRSRTGLLFGESRRSQSDSAESRPGGEFASTGLAGSELTGSGRTRSGLAGSELAGAGPAGAELAGAGLAGSGRNESERTGSDGSGRNGSEQAGWKAVESRYDAVLLDVMLPGQSGFEVVAALRAASNYVPVLMLTARSRPEDVLHGLEAGADDYLPKPFDLSILLARLHVLLRRMRWQSVSRSPEAGEPDGDEGEPEQPTRFSFAGRTIDFSLLELHAKGSVVRLTLMEADFLRYLSRHPFRIIPRTELLEQVWRVREDTDTRAIDNFVVRLRRYLEDEPTNPVYLKTVRGVGYRFLPNGE